MSFLDTLSDYASNGFYAVVPTLVVILFVGLLWHVLHWRTRFDDDEELFIKNNCAYAVQRISLCVAQVVGMLHVLSYSIEDDGMNALFWMVAEGAWVMFALLCVRPVVDWVVLYRINNMAELRKGNLAVGVIEAGFYVAFGFLLNASLDGEAPTVATGLASTAIFGLLGLIVLIAVFWFHEYMTPYHLREGILQGKLTAAVEAAAILIGMAVVVSAGVSGDFTSWGAGFAGFFATVVLAVPALYVARFVIDHVVLKNCTVKSIQEHDQLVAAIVLAALLVLVSFPVEIAIKTHL